MPTYVTVQNVLDFLFIMFEPSDPNNLVNKFQTWISDRIDETELWLEEKCRTAWTAKSRTDTLKRVFALQNREGRYRLPFYLPYSPVTNIIQVQVDTGSGWSTLSSSEYIWDEHGVYISFRFFQPYKTIATVRVTYSYGYTEAQADVKGAIIRKVVLELFGTGAIQPFLTKQPTESMIKHMETYIREVIMRYSRPQILPI